MCRSVFTFSVKSLSKHIFQSRLQPRSLDCVSLKNASADVHKVSHGRYYHTEAPLFLSLSMVKQASREIKPLTFHLFVKIARSPTDSCSLREARLQHPPFCDEVPPFSTPSVALRYCLFLKPTSNISITIDVMGNMLMCSPIARFQGAQHSSCAQRIQ